jgi:hypothetical protein
MILLCVLTLLGAATKLKDLFNFKPVAVTWEQG